MPRHDPEQRLPFMEPVESSPRGRFTKRFKPPGATMPRNRKGFTLIELLIVVVIIGILAAIALPKFGQTRQRAYVSAMQADVNQIRTAMEMWYQDNTFTYAGATVAGLDVNLSPGVSVATEIAGTATDWSVSLGHDAYDGATCTYDTAHPENPGSIFCTTP
jgi:type IV pilus assembly protein PilA